MKNYLLSKNWWGFVTLLALCFQLNAQNSVFVETPSCIDSTEWAVVRTVPDGTDFVSFHWHDPKGEFLLVSPTCTTTAQRILIPDIFVSDFTIMKEYLYFCGSKGGQAVFGKFMLSDFYQPTCNIEYETFSSYDAFTKMKTYIDPNTSLVTVAVSGYKYDPTNPNPYKIYLNIFQINGTSLNQMEYSTNNIFNNSYIHNFHDVTVTDNYIVWTYIEQLANAKLYVFKVPKAYLSSGNLCEYIDNTSLALNSAVAIENLYNDDVAIASYLYDNPDHYMRLYTIDVASFNPLNIQDVPITEKTDPNDLLFDPSDGSLLMLLTAGRYPIPQATSSIIYFLKPYINSYASTLLYDKDNRYYSLDLYGSLKFLAGGRSSQQLHHYFFQDRSSGLNMSCLSNDVFKVYPGYNITFIDNQYNLNPNTKTLIPLQAPVDNITISTPCSN